MTTELINACCDGDLMKVISLYKNGTDIHADNECGLRWCSLYGHLDIVKYICEHDPNHRVYSNTALQFASKEGHFEIVKYLCEYGADIGADQNATLNSAVEKGYLEIVKYLYEKGYGNDYALRLASYHGHLHIVKYVCENGANIHSENNAALLFAVCNGNFEIVKYLCENGANINDDLASYAAKYEYIDIMKYLLNNNANINLSENCIKKLQPHIQYEIEIFNNRICYKTKNSNKK